MARQNWRRNRNGRRYHVGGRFEGYAGPAVTLASILETNGESDAATALYAVAVEESPDIPLIQITARVRSAKLRADEGQGEQALDELRMLLVEAETLEDNAYIVAGVHDTMVDVLIKLKRLFEALEMANELWTWLETHHMTGNATALSCRKRRALLNFELGKESMGACNAEVEAVRAIETRVFGAEHPTTMKTRALMEDLASLCT